MLLLAFWNLMVWGKYEAGQILILFQVTCFVCPGTFFFFLKIQNLHQNMSDMSVYSLIILCTQQLKTIFFCCTTNYCIISFVYSSGTLIFFRKVSLCALVFILTFFSFFDIIFCLFFPICSESFSNLCSSSLICFPVVLNLFFPDRAVN